jgi:hypothetical protein
MIVKAVCLYEAARRIHASVGTVTCTFADKSYMQIVAPLIVLPLKNFSYSWLAYLVAL